MQSPTSWFDQLTDEQLISAARHHAADFDAAWCVSMATYYKEGRHIDAQVSMDRSYKALGALVDYVYNHRPWKVWEEVTQAANWES